jgi:hypothetical protein
MLKGVEVSIVLVPSTLIQMHALSTPSFSSGIVLYVLAGCLALTCLSVVNTIVGMDITKDVDLRNRSFCPQFYGVIPASNLKTVVITGMGLMAGSQLAMTMFKLVLMKEMHGMGFTVLYMVGRQIIWHLIKLARGDWMYCELIMCVVA